MINYTCLRAVNISAILGKIIKYLEQNFRSESVTSCILTAYSIYSTKPVAQIAQINFLVICLHIRKIYASVSSIGDKQA
jgi:hypothetical protein